MNDAISLLMDVQNGVRGGRRHALRDLAPLVPVVQSILDQLGGRESAILNSYLFGAPWQGRPFELTADGVIYYGDAARATRLWILTSLKITSRSPERSSSVQCPAACAEWISTRR